MLRTTVASITTVVVTIAALCAAHESAAGPLTSAEVTKIINEVRVIEPAKGGHPAALREVIKDDLALQTGVKSRSELLFQDYTLTRIGAETFFSFKTGTRDMTLEKGSMLLQVPKGLGGAKIHTAAVTAAITGTTIMIEYIPNQYIKVLVLEGSLRLARNGVFGDSLVLRPGKMVIMRPDAKKIPDPVDVDLQHIVKTSSLVNFPGAQPLPSMPLMQAAINDQHNQLAKKDLVPTNLVMGHGTNVAVTSGNPLATTSSGGILGAPTATAKNGTLSLPLVGNVASALGGTTTATTTTVNNLLTSTTGTVGTVASNLLAATSTVTSIPISSSTQLLELLNNTVPNAVGTVTVAPTAVKTILAAVPSAIVTSNPAVSGVTTAAANTVTGIIPSTSSATPSTGLLSSILTVISAAPTSLVNTVASPPTILATGIVPPQRSPASILPLGLGH